jgi:hypothetical protein
MRLPSWILCALMTVTAPALSACASDTGDETGPVDDGDGDDGNDDGSGGGDDGSGGGDDGGGEQPGTPDGGGTAEACAAPGAVGNAGGVGEYCTKGGGECDDNDEATYCTVDYQDGAPPFCTMPCFSEGTCGEGAVCTSDGGGLSGCAPDCVAEGGA